MGSSSEVFTNVSSSIKNVLFATGTLNHAIDSFSSIALKLEQKSKELADKEASLQLLEKEIASREAECKEWTLLLEKREKDVEAREVRSKDMNNSPPSTTTTDDIHINVGGSKFIATKAMLNRPGSFFEIMLSGDLSKECYIDRRSKHFGTILNYLREGVVPDLNPEDLAELTTELEFYKLDIPPPTRVSQKTIKVYNQKKYEENAINIISKFDKSFLSRNQQDSVCSWLPNHRFIQIYKASRDGFTSEAFHKNCDNQESTLTVIQSKEGHLFGGYTPEAWESTSKWKTNPSSFIFTLSNPHSIPPTKYSLKPNDAYAVLCCSSPNKWCFAFGGGSDIILCSDSNFNDFSHSNFPLSYIDTTGKGKETFTGNCKFLTLDVEVYYAIEKQ